MNGDLMPPLVYSTELARSVKLEFAKSVHVRLDKTKPRAFQEVNAYDTKMSADEWRFPRWLSYVPISTDLIYGLVNVRPDGQQILIGTMLEKGTGFETKVIQAG